MASSRTETRRLLVRIGDEDPGGTYPVQWVRLMEGEKRGLNFAVLTWHPQYSDEMIDELDALETGDIVKMRFTNLNERQTEWGCSELTDRDGTIRATQYLH